MKINFNKAMMVMIATIAFSCSKSDEKPSKESLLTNNSSKSWNITYSSFDKDEPDESCKEVSVRTADNIWTFKTKGAFEFNPGAIGEIPDCPECNCSDFTHLKGTWSLFSNEDSLSIIATGKIEDNGSITDFDDIEIWRAKLKSLSATEMVFGGAQYVTFKPK